MLFPGSVIKYGETKEARMKNPSALLHWIFKRELLTPPQKAFAGGSLWVGLGAAIMLFDEFLVFFVPFFCLELGVGTLAARFLSRRARRASAAGCAPVSPVCSRSSPARSPVPQGEARTARVRSQLPSR